jgi:enoyl-CoA hydratase/carnithine racemase
MLLTGRTVDAATAADWGIVARVVAHERLAAESMDVLAACCRTAPAARAAAKKTFHEYYGHYDRMAMDASLRGDESVEGYRAFKERRSPSWVPEDFRTDGRL